MGTWGENRCERRSGRGECVTPSKTTRRCSFVRELHRATTIRFHASKTIRFRRDGSKRSVPDETHLRTCFLDFINNSRTRNHEERESGRKMSQSTRPQTSSYVPNKPVLRESGLKAESGNSPRVFHNGRHKGAKVRATSTSSAARAKMVFVAQARART